MKRLVFLILLCVGVLAAPAAARERVGEVKTAHSGLSAAKQIVLPPVQPGAFPRQRPADSRLWAEVTVAIEFWRARGVTGCPGGIAAYTVQSFPFDASVLAAAASEIEGLTGCEVWVLERFVIQNRRALRSAYAWSSECAVVTHEVGHAFGLDHSEEYGGVMSTEELKTPRECKRWARQMVERWG